MLTIVGSTVGIMCRFCIDLYVCSRCFQKICQHHGKASGVSRTLLTMVKSHIGTENNMVVTYFSASHCTELDAMVVLLSHYVINLY